MSINALELTSLISDPNHAFRVACEEGRKEIVTLLLANNNVDPSVDDNYAFRIASQKGHIKIVKLLLADNRVNPEMFEFNHSAIKACENGHLKVAKLLLADQRLYPWAFQSCAVVASRNGHSEVVKLILADQRFSPGMFKDCVIEAIEKGHTRVVKLLLNAAGNLGSDNYILIQLARQQGHKNIANYQIDYNRLDSDLDYVELSKMAKEAGHTNIYACLESYSNKGLLFAYMACADSKVKENSSFNRLPEEMCEEIFKKPFI